VESVTIPTQIGSNSEDATKHSLKNSIAFHPHDGVAVAKRTEALQTETQRQAVQWRKQKLHAYWWQFWAEVLPGAIVLSILGFTVSM
jgi:hypothetical protein